MTRIAPVLFLALLAAFLALPSCGATPQQTARHTVDIIAEALVVTDAASAQAYTDHAHAALAAAHSLAEYQSAMAGYDALERALRTLEAALHLADAAVILWEHGGVSSWPQAIACVAGALQGVRETLEAAGLVLPIEVTAALDLLHGIVPGDGCFATPVPAVAPAIDGGV